jgi:proteasome lid subunit RPN8/RPN11
MLRPPTIPMGTISAVMPLFLLYQKNLRLWPVNDRIVMDHAKRHAEEVFPKESIGVAYDDKYFRLENTHSEPENNYSISKAAYAELFMQHGEPKAVIHSHTNGTVSPSTEDMQFQLDSGVACGILTFDKNKRHISTVFWGGETKMAPPEGRIFIHGVYDCYATCRDAYIRDWNIKLPEFPREWGWWERDHKTDLLIENFKVAGFREVDVISAKRGDIFLGRYLGTQKINHCAYYEGNGIILHHLSGTAQRPRLSTRESFYTYRSFVTHCVRHESLE